MKVSCLFVQGILRSRPLNYHDHIIQRKSRSGRQGRADGKQASGTKTALYNVVRPRPISPEVRDKACHARCATRTSGRSDFVSLRLRDPCHSIFMNRSLFDPIC